MVNLTNPNRVVTKEILKKHIQKEKEIFLTKQEIIDKVDKTTTINGHALEEDVVITKSDIGLGSVDNKSEATIKEDFTGAIAANDTGFVKGEDVYEHTSNIENPHSVTKAQVGLGNVENKSVAEIKSVLTGSISENDDGFILGGDVHTLKESIEERLDSVEGKIPSHASSSNKLVTEEFVNSSVASSTATFRGTYNILTQLNLEPPVSEQQIAAALVSKMRTLSITPDNNDYVYISYPGDLEASFYTKFERYKYNGTAWLFEQVLNHSSYTAKQWAAITSEITPELVRTYNAHLANTENPHSVTKEQVGLGNVDNKSPATLRAEFTGQIANNNDGFVLGGDVYNHTSNHSNPHQVSKSQVGLGNVDNTSDLNKPISTATQEALDTKVDKVEGKSLVDNSKITLYNKHLQSTSNPHSVTKTQVGLGNVDNTSDINKPISTATQEALDTKVDKESGKGLSENDFTDAYKSYVEANNEKVSANNSKITIQKNGTKIDDFTLNQSSDKTINIIVPTQSSDVNALPDTTKYGSSIEMSINTTNYKITTTLKDQNGDTLGSPQEIDLPLESVVVDGSYDDNAKKIVLTLKSGSTVEFSVADLISGLQSEINSNNKLDADLVDDSSSTHKFTSSSEKETWNAKVPNTRKVNGHTLDGDVSVTKSDIGLGNVDNKSSATIKSEFTGSIASGNSGFVTGGDAYTALAGKVSKDTTTGTFVYAHNGATEVQLAYKVDAVAFSVVQRDVNGNVKVALTPVDNDDAISKKYIDDCFTEVDIEED